MTHYDVLGVAPSADATEVHRAYVELARRHHPDADGGDAEAMLRLNEAWAVLGDARARARYDATLGHRDDRSFARRPATVPFVPLDGDDDESDDWRYEPDIGDPRTAPGRQVLLAPWVALWLAAGCVGGWLITDATAFVVAATMLAALAVLAFLAAPLVAMAKASHYERSGGPAAVGDDG